MEVSYINGKSVFPDRENEKKRIINLLNCSQKVPGSFITDLDLADASSYLRSLIKELTDMDVLFTKFECKEDGIPGTMAIKEYLFIAEKELLTIQ